MIVRELLFKLGFDSLSAQRNASRFERTIGTITIGLLRMGQVAVAAGAAAAVSGSRIVDEYTALNSRIKLVTDSAEQLKAAQQGIYEVAQLTGSATATVADLYIRLARSTKRFGYDQLQTLKVTEAINKALVVSGDSSSPGAQAALFQLGQGLQSGTLRGEELNSVLEQAPRIAEAIAAGMGIPFEELRKQAEQGAITTTAIMEALLNQYENIDKEFNLMDNRQSQSRMRLINAYKRTIFEISREENAMDGLVDIYDSLREIVESDEFKQSFRALINLFVFFTKTVVHLIPVLMNAYSEMAAFFNSIPAWVKILAALTTGIWLMNAAFNANKIVFVLSAASASLILFLDDLANFKKGNKSVIGEIVRMWEDFGVVISYVIQKPLDNFKIMINGMIEIMNRFGGNFEKFVVDIPDLNYKVNPDSYSPIRYNTPFRDPYGRSMATNNNVFQPTYNISVPEGSRKEQGDFLIKQLEKNIDGYMQKQYRLAMNNNPEVE